VLLAFLARALVPPGYMIGMAEAAGAPPRFTIVLCPQSKSVQLPSADAHKAQTASHNGGHHHSAHSATSHAAHHHQHHGKFADDDRTSDDPNQDRQSNDSVCPFATVGSIAPPQSDPDSNLIHDAVVRRTSPLEQPQTPVSLAAAPPPSTGPPQTAN
jgi:hypothetical protein